ncbi:holo-ACP synthase [Ammoniphilus resinae]|uniref:Holo-[acyl-carrier-protein] synthase n=1 Tax=Ammoniphilus resinae TaxID=861532 RepID=A0ABS4GIG0_9BACL|nr:holo-ACP synthase [Ammoniphilus resinae]MBP1930029.1 holo-[acyl-carrier protein] synthase [Ammoniphilus resinae]
MIIGTGIDMVDKRRIKKTLDRLGERFLRRILTGRELSLVPEGSRKVEYVAGRFAAKEAFAKATGFGFGKRLSWLDIEVLREDSGKPTFVIANQWLDSSGLGKGPLKVHLSISHEKNYAIAQVILEG